MDNVKAWMIFGCVLVASCNMSEAVKSWSNARYKRPCDEDSRIRLDVTKPPAPTTGGTDG